jgi:hypothetical protein
LIQESLDPRTEREENRPTKRGKRRKRNINTMDYSDPNAFTLPFQLTKTIRRDVYPLLEPTQPELSAKGKTVLITGVSGGIGKVCHDPRQLNLSLA